MSPPTRSVTDADLGRAVVRALAAKDAARLHDLFDDGVDFRALTPGRFWGTTSAAGVVDDIWLGTWFADGTEIERVESVRSGTVAGRTRVDYQLRLRCGACPMTVAQTAYYGVARGHITSMQLLCSGFRPVAGR